MTLSIKDPRTDRLARKLAEATGQSITEAVHEAIRMRLESLPSSPQDTVLIERLRAIGRKCAAHMQPPFSSLDHGEILYDQHGLPK